MRSIGTVGDRQGAAMMSVTSSLLTVALIRLASRVQQW
jgi:hypothetical protein